MTLYQLTVLDAAQGRASELPLEASSEEAARAVAGQRGLTVLDCHAQTSTTAPGLGTGTRWNVAEWARELNTLLRSGMTVVEALDTLRAQGSDARRTAVLDALLSGLQAGRTLSAAMVTTGAFPAILVAGVKASERTSNLKEALEDYLRYDGMLGGLKRKVVSSAVYPAVVASVGLAVTLFLLAFVIPRFAVLYQGQTAEPGTATKILLWVSGLLTTRLPLLGLCAAAVAASAVWAWRRGTFARGLGAVVQAVPVFRRLSLEFSLARLYQSLCLMVRGGYPLSEALAQCVQLEPRSPLVPGLQRIEALLLRGGGIAAGLAQEKLADVTDSRLLAVGERSGNFDEVLQTISQRHAERFATGIDRVTRLVEPLMLLAVSALVGGIVVLMYMPVFDIAAGIR